MNNNNFSTTKFLKTDLSTGNPNLDIPATLNWISATTDKMSEYDKILSDYKKQIEEHNKEMESQKSELIFIKSDIEKQKNRIPEIVGIFSAIIALVLIDVSIVKSAETFLSAILLILSLTCSLSIFLFIVHVFFSPEDGKKIKERYVWVPVFLLWLLTILGIFIYYFDFDVYKIENKKNALSQENKIEDHNLLKSKK